MGSCHDPIFLRLSTTMEPASVNKILSGRASHPELSVNIQIRHATGQPARKGVTLGLDAIGQEGVLHPYTLVPFDSITRPPQHYSDQYATVKCKMF